MTTFKDSDALYGIISATGGTWTVYFRAKENTSSHLTGYGDFPRDRFPTIPICDYRTVKRFKLIDGPKEAYACFNETCPSLADYLDAVAATGATVTR